MSERTLFIAFMALLLLGGGALFVWLKNRQARVDAAAKARTDPPSP